MYRADNERLKTVEFAMLKMSGLDFTGDDADQVVATIGGFGPSPLSKNDVTLLTCAAYLTFQHYRDEIKRARDQAIKDGDVIADQLRRLDEGQIAVETLTRRLRDSEAREFELQSRLNGDHLALRSRSITSTEFNVDGKSVTTVDYYEDPEIGKTGTTRAK